MNDQVRRITDGIFTAILLYLVVANADGFGQVISTSGSAISKVAYTLQGRKDVLGRPA